MLLTQENRKALPALYANENAPVGSAVAHVKIFDPFGRFTFYVTEFDGEDTLFGYTVSALGPDCDEWGYGSLSELEAVQGRFGIGLERDRSFSPAPVSEVLA